MSAAVATRQREANRIEDCDAALELLRVAVRTGPLEERDLARISIDHVLDRRLALSGPRRRRT